MPTDQKPFDDATLQAMFAEQGRDDGTDPEWIAIKEARRRFEEIVRALFVGLGDEVPADLPAYRERVREVALAYAACINGARGDTRSITRAVQSVHLSYMLATKALAYQGRLRATLLADTMRESLAASLVACAAVSARRALEPTRHLTERTP